MQFTDTHCHIHEAQYPLDKGDVLIRARQNGVNRLICVGTDEVTSAEAVSFVQGKADMWASVGLHPHDAVHGMAAIAALETLLQDEKKIVAIGECGLDYFYNHSPRETQFEMLDEQMKLALQYDIPMIFHVREAFDDFWPLFDKYQSAGQLIRGVVHSFTDTQENLQKALDRGLLIGVNGISTFTKVDAQTEMYRQIPLDRLILETDAPYLTPTPLRGKVNEPAFVTHVAKYIANLQSINLTELSLATERNATRLFSL
ncbi:TatD family hydrolase [Pedobacter sp.]|nr:TatD family hydrolase [Candidatus Saccharibacteria bacterium]